ncbi:MAG: prephenate dehydratase [Pseudanabaenaceae cyanobacterium]
MTTIAYLGPRGSYSEMAALAFAQGGNYQLLTQNTIEQAMALCANYGTDLAIVPVENSLYGSVGATLDGLWQWANLQIAQALILPIRHCLLSHAPSLDSIHTVYSHAQGLGQCQQWLNKHLPHAQQISVDSTTYGVQLAKDQPHAGAIASVHAGTIYHMPILAQDISDNPSNYTRFLVLTNQQTAQTGAYSSWGFSFAENRAGTLARALNTFAQRNINLSRIESRPSKRSLGDYIFFVDIEGNWQEAGVQSAWQELGSMTETLKHFGSYDVISP